MGAEVMSIVRPGARAPGEIVAWDALEREQTAPKGLQIVYHLAANCRVSDTVAAPASFFRDNVNLTLRILEWMRAHAPQGMVVYLSTDRVYGRFDGSTADEETMPSPVDLYAASKLAGEDLCRAYAATFGLRYVVLRSSIVFGPGQRPGLFIPSLVERILTDGVAHGRVRHGNLDARRNYIYVDDLVDALLLAADDGCVGQKFNVTAYHVKVREVFERMIDLAKRRFGRTIAAELDQTLVRPAATELPTYGLSTRRAREVLRWKPRIEFEDALGRTFEAACHS